MSDRGRPQIDGGVLSGSPLGNHLEPVAPPVVDPGEFAEGKPFQYSAVIEVKPEIRLEGYTG